MTPPVLSFDRVTYRYPEAPAPALEDVTFALAPGEFCVVAGLSASGKSTAIRAAAGLVPHFHGGEFGGRVVAGGLDTREHGPADVAAVAGTLLQDPETQVVLNTVRAELSLPLENRGHGPAAVARGVEEAALALGIAGLLDRPTHELSGGELQRVALGAALAGRPRLVLLDEPTSQLDPVAGDELIWLLRRLNEEWGTTIVLAEHRLERCLAAADRVLAFDAGRLVCDATPRDFLGWAADAAPALQTPGARLFERAGLRPPPSGVKEARATLRAHGLLDETPSSEPAQGSPAAADGVSRPRTGYPGVPRSGTRGYHERGPAVLNALFSRAGSEPKAVELRGVWHEFTGGRAVLRGVDFAVAPGERVALMGRNGAGKSTLLRHAAGLLAPTRGKVECAGRVALLLQNPGDYVLHQTVGEEAPAQARAAAGLTVAADRNPRDLSGGERQRLALAVVLGAGERPAVVCLDEPTRGLDRGAKGDLASRLRALAAEGSAVVVATHDPEFAAAFADRVVLLADGRQIADGSAGEVLTGGWYFATETARIVAGALLPEDGAERLRRRLTIEVSP
jgi:energy-coupling factor transport system ATP-binding protein